MTVIELTESDMSTLGEFGEIEVSVPGRDLEKVSGADLGHLALDDLLAGETVPYGDLLLTYPV